MRDLLRVTSVVFTSAPALDQARGMLGWVRFRVNGWFEIDGVRVRRTRGGRVALAFPTRQDNDGQRHYVVRPLDDATRIAVEAQVLAELRRQKRLAS